MDEWVKVSDRLPLKEDLVHNSEQQVWVYTQGAVLLSYVDTDADFIDDFFDYLYVTHWCICHRPDAPREE